MNLFTVLIKTSFYLELLRRLNAFSISIMKTESEFKEFEPRLKFKPRLKYGWFYLKLYSIETGF